MAWLSGLANKAENLLNSIDASAGQALSNEDENLRGQMNTAPNQSRPQHHNQTAKSHSMDSNPMVSSVSVPSNLSGMHHSSEYLSQLSNPSSIKATHSTSSPSSRTPSSTGVRKDKDADLFEFLNAPEVAAKRNGKRDSRHSRQSSASSVASAKSGPAVMESFTHVSMPPDTSSTPPLAPEAAVPENAGLQEPQDDMAMHADSSSGYHSQGEDTAVAQQQVSALELENRLLKNEVQSLNQEMAAVLDRAKQAQTEVVVIKQKMQSMGAQQSQSDQQVRELRAREEDLREALQAKDSQLGVLRVRFEESDKEKSALSQNCDLLRGENERILRDHTSSSGVQSQALDSLQEKLRLAEDALQREREAGQQAQREAAERQGKLEAEQQSLSSSLATTQRRAADEKARFSELNVQLKVAKGQAETTRADLASYKEKAARILQSKDRLIATLKDGGGVAGSDVSVAQEELEAARQERDMLREELTQSRANLESARTEVQELEVQQQTDADAAYEQMTSLEEQLKTEKNVRKEAEIESEKQKQELRFAHEELVKLKTAMQSRVQDREQEIERLRTQITTKQQSSTSQVELENRLHALTESLIQKQTMLEALGTEKNSLILQLERMEKQYKEVEAAAMRSNTTTVNMEDDTVRSRATFLRVSPMDGQVTRKVKHAASAIDTFSIRLGVFLRRYPIARVFVIVYMAMLHAWVMLVLLTYQPEMHGADYHPRPPT